MKPRPEPGVSYAAAPTDEYRAASRLEAARGLAAWLGVTETRATALLEDETALVAEIRSHEAVSAEASNRLLAGMGDPLAAGRVLRRAYRP